MLSYRMQFIKPKLFLFPLALVALTFVAPAMFASEVTPACGVATLSVYDSDGYECTIGDYTLQDFTFESSGSEDQNLLSDSEILVTPTITGSGVSVQFSPTDGNSFGITYGDAEYQVQYYLDPQFPTISGASVDLGPNDPVTLTGQFCGDGMIYGPYVAGQPTQCVGSDPTGIFPLTVVTTGNMSSQGASFPSLVTDLDSRLILDLDASDGPVNVDYFGSTANTVTPEPSSALWLVPGMLGLAWLRKRVKA